MLYSKYTKSADLSNRHTTSTTLQYENNLQPQAIEHADSFLEKESCPCINDKRLMLDFKHTFVGSWKEDQKLRRNLYKFLRVMGIGWFEAVYATNSEWENEQSNILTVDGKEIFVAGKRGPLNELFEVRVVLDNRTVNPIDMGVLGGPCRATAEIKENNFVVYVRKTQISEIFFTATHSINESNINLMLIEAKHVPSGVTLKSYYKRTAF